MPAADYIEANRTICAAMAGFIERSGCAGLVLPSSGAVYAADGALENDMARNPYGMLKLEDELVFSTLARRLGFPAAIIRVFNLAGPFINKLGSYAMASIISDIARGGPVMLRAAHPVWRSYTHIEDLLRIATTILQRGMDMAVFDTAGEPVEIGDLAVRANLVLAAEAALPIHRPTWEHGVADRYLGAPEPYCRIAKLCNVTPRLLEQQISETAQYIAACP